MDQLGIAMQMLSPMQQAPTAPELQAWNDYGAQLVADHPGRFGLLAGLQTDRSRMRASQRLSAATPRPTRTATC